VSLSPSKEHQVSRSTALQPPHRRRTVTFVAAVLALALAMLAGPIAPADASYDHRGPSVAVANRGSGDLSVIDAETLAVESFDLPGNAEPMYVSHDTRNDRVLVGDRASSTIIALDDETYEVVDTVEVGAGVFHQWLDVRRRQLWVVGDTSNTVTVVDSRHLEVVATIDIPNDLVARGGKPHDVFVSGRRAFVSILGLDDGTGVVLQYSTRNFDETGRVTTGADPHLFVTGNRLYVASQGGSKVSRFRANSLELVETITVPSAHGIYVTNRNEVIVTNIAGGGTDAVWELNRRLTRVEDVTDTGYPTPHNVTVSSNVGGNRQVFVTHSGSSANQVSAIPIGRGGFGEPHTVTVGTNPFGLAFVR
jgi:hypothetical protein